MPVEIPSTTSLSGTAVFWLLGCMTIVVASRIDSFLERRRARIQAERDLKRRRDIENCLLVSKLSQRRGRGYGPSWWRLRSQSAPTTPSSSTPWPLSGLQTSLPSSPGWTSGSTCYDMMNAADIREWLWSGMYPAYENQDTESRQGGTAKSKGLNSRVRSKEWRRPMKSRRETRYTRPYIMDWLDEQRAYLYQ